MQPAPATGNQVAPLLPPPVASNRVYTNPLATLPPLARPHPSFSQVNSALPPVNAPVSADESRRAPGAQPSTTGSTVKRLLLYAHGSTPGAAPAFLECVRPGEVALVAFDPATQTVRQVIASAKAAAAGLRLQSVGVLAPVETVNGIGTGLRLAGKPGDVVGLLAAQTLQASWELQELVRELGGMVVSWGRIHLLSSNLLPNGADLVQACRERACRPCSAGKGDTLRDQFRLAAEEGDDVYACARLYFKRAKLEKFINDIDGEEDDNSAVKKHTEKIASKLGAKKLLHVGSKLKGEMKDKDNAERAQTIGATVPFLYSVLMASFLSIFVPQKCPSGKTCSLSENVTDLKTYNKIVLAFNCGAALALVSGQILYVRRENWMIKHLDEDQGEAYDALADGAFVERYPHLSEPLHRHNRRCTVISVVTLIVLGMNFVLSAVLVLHLYYDGTRTITALITNSLLVGLHIKTSYAICFDSWKKGLAISTARSQPISYNVVDSEFADTAKEKP